MTLLIIAQEGLLLVLTCILMSHVSYTNIFRLKGLYSYSFISKGNISSAGL